MGEPSCPSALLPIAAGPQLLCPIGKPSETLPWVSPMPLCARSGEGWGGVARRHPVAGVVLWVCVCVFGGWAARDFVVVVEGLIWLAPMRLVLCIT